MEQIKKRDLKIQSKKTEEEKEYRLCKQFNMLVGDDTGLMKKVRMVYRY